VLDYDLVILAPAIAFLVSTSRTSGFRSYDVSLLAFAWIAPLFARAIAGACGVPIGLVTVAALFVLAMQHVIGDRAIPSLARDRIAQA
jgi:alpha-1,2-mannosyltransferase